MANYSVLYTVDADGWTQGTVKRSPTALSGGTSISLPTQDAASHIGIHTTLGVVLRGFANRQATSGKPATNFAALITDNSDGTFTPTLKYDITSVTGGTAVTLPSALQTTGLPLQAVHSRASRAVKNDRATNG